MADVIRWRYGNHVLRIIRRYEKLDYRIRKPELDIQFLETCLNNDLCPTFVRYKMSNKRLQNSEAYVQSQRLFLHEEIMFKNVEKEKISSKLRKIISDLRTVINLIDWKHINNKFMESNIKACRKVEQIQSYKISELMGSKLKHNSEEVIHNFSSYNCLLLKNLYYVKD